MERDKDRAYHLANEYVIYHEVFSLLDIMNEIEEVRHGEKDTSLETKIRLMEEVNSWLDFVPNSGEQRYALRNNGQGWHLAIVDKDEIQ